MVAMKSVAIVAFLQLATAAPKPRDPTLFKINEFFAFQPSCRSGDDAGLFEISFSVSDPTDSSSTSCKATWTCAEGIEGYPAEFVTCEDSSYAFKLTNFKDISAFKLDAKHTIEDNSRVTRYAAGDVIDRDNVYCSRAASGFVQCIQQEDVEFVIPVYNSDAQ